MLEPKDYLAFNRNSLGGDSPHEPFMPFDSEWKLALWGNPNGGTLPVANPMEWILVRTEQAIVNHLPREYINRQFTQLLQFSYCELRSNVSNPKVYAAVKDILAKRNHPKYPEIAALRELQQVLEERRSDDEH